MQMSDGKKYPKRCEEHGPLWSVVHILGPWSMVSSLDQGPGTVVCPLDHDPGSLLDKVYGALPI